MENSQQNSWKCLVSGLCWIHSHSCPKLCLALLKRASRAIFYYSCFHAHQNPLCTQTYRTFFCPMSFSFLLTSTCVPVYVEQLMFDCGCALFCCGVFHAHLLHVEMKLRYFMWWWCDPMSSSTRQTQPDHVFPLTVLKGSSDRVLCRNFWCFTFWADGVGLRRTLLFQNSLLMVPFPSWALFGLLPLFSRLLALTPRTRKWKFFNWEMCLLMTLGSIPAWRAILSGSLITLHGWPFWKVSVVLSLTFSKFPFFLSQAWLSSFTRKVYFTAFSGDKCEKKPGHIASTKTLPCLWAQHDSSSILILKMG